jgi:hypothetical protein
MLDICINISSANVYYLEPFLNPKVLKSWYCQRMSNFELSRQTSHLMTIVKQKMAN